MRDLVIDMDDFMHKLQSVKPWIIRKQELPLGAGEHRQTNDADRRVQAVQPVHQLHALLRGLPRLRS